MNNGMNPNNNDDLNNVLKEFQGNFKYLLAFALVLIILVGGYSSVYQVEPEEEAIIIRLGKKLTTTAPGLHFKLPFGVDRVIKVKTKTIHQIEFGFRANNTGRRRTYQNTNYESESLMLTGDLNVANVKWVVQYNISDPFKYKFKTKYPVKNIKDVSESIMRRVIGDRLVTEVLTTGRAEIEGAARPLMQDLLDKYDMGVNITEVKLQDVNPPESVKPSFNEVNEAKQEQEKVINQAERAYNKVIPEAKGKAQKLISEAEGYAMELVNRSYGDAEKFSTVLKEYQRAPKITKKRIYLETMEHIFKKFEDLTIVDSAVKGVLPVFQKAIIQK